MKAGGNNGVPFVQDEGETTLQTPPHLPRNTNLGIIPNGDSPMEKKSVMPMVAVALLGCIVLMLSVMGGLYAYNTFLASAPAVHAQAGSDKGPNWTVTPVTVGGNTQLVMVITETENPYEAGKQTKQMAVYEVRGNNGKADLYFVAARTMEYDFKFPDLQGQAMNNDKFSPIKLKKAAEDAAKKKGD